MTAQFTQEKSPKIPGFPSPRKMRVPSLQPNSPHEKDLAILGATHTTYGDARGGVVRRDFPLIYGAALLDSFFFNYLDTDHELNRIQITPGSPAPDTIEIGFHDKDRDDAYLFNIVHRSLYDPQIEKWELTGGVGKGTWWESIADTKPTPGDFVFVLRGFEFSYQSDVDNRIARIEVREHNGRLIVAFADKNPDLYNWSVQWAWVPRHLFSFVGALGMRHVTGGSTQPMGHGASVLRGFQFQFNRRDREIKSIGAMTPDDSRIEVYFEDKNRDDKYDWLVEFGLLRT